MKIVCAIKREHRDDQDKADWVRKVAETPGVTKVGDTNSGRVLIEADAETAKELTDKFGQFLHIEPIIQHKPIKGEGE